MVKISADSDNQFYINDHRKVETLTFDSSNWDLLQSIQLQAIDDNNVEDITASNLSFEITSKDNNFNNIKVDPVQIDIVDNDLPYVSLIPISDSSEEAEPGSFRIELSEPAPSSEGANGIVVNYEITNVDFDPEAFESLEPNSLNPDEIFIGITNNVAKLLGESELFAFSTTESEGFG